MTVDTETGLISERPALDKIAEALAAFQAEMPIVAKSHTANVRSEKGSYSYTYAGLADVCEAAMPLLAKHGLSFSCAPQRGELVGMLLHSSGQSLTGSLPITGGTPQAIGSSLTYMRRYLLGCLTGIVTDDDEDGQLAEKASRTQRRERSEKPSDEQAPADQQSRDPGAISPAQLGKIGALMGDLGIRDRDSALAYVADVIGRAVASRNELTKAEASKLIEALAAEVDKKNAAGEVQG